MSVKLLAQNLLESGTVTVSSAAATKPKERLYDRDRSLPWAAAASGSDRTVSLDGGRRVTADAIAIVNPTLSRYAMRVRALGAISLWRLGDASGNATDSIGAHPGTASGSPAYGATGLLATDSNTAVEFDGVDDLFEAADHADFEDQSFSIDCWIKPYELADRTIMSRWIIGAANVWRLSLTSTGRIVFETSSVGSGGADNTLQTPAGVIAADGTYHVAVTHSGAATIIYVNGVEQVAGGAMGISLATTAALRIGVDGGGGATFFYGIIDEVAFYPSALSASSVLSLYTHGSTASIAILSLAADDTSPASTSRAVPILNGLDVALTEFTSVSRRYWLLTLPGADVAQAIGEVMLGTIRTISEDPVIDSLPRSTVGNVQRMRSPGGYPWAAQRGSDRARFEYAWKALTVADLAILETAYADCNQGAKNLVVVDPDGVARWMTWLDDQLTPIKVGVDPELYDIACVFEEAL